MANDGESVLHGVTTAEPIPGREIWVLTVPDLRHLARIATVLDRVERVVSPQTMAGAASSFSNP